MPCDDCSRTENCPPCVNEPPPLPPVDPAVKDRCKCGHIRFRHQGDESDGRCAAKCECTAFRPVTVQDVHLPGDGPQCGCGHGRFSHQTAAGADGPCVTQCGCQGYESKACEHVNRRVASVTVGGGLPEVWRYECRDCGQELEDPHDWHRADPLAGGTCRACGMAFKNWSGNGCPGAGTEPPLPEKQEHAPCVCGHIEPEHDERREYCSGDDCDCSLYRTEADFELPPQPERRPPYAVAYSAGGHLYEVALPGDAVVSAEDGALIIKHPDFPVHGIVRVLPVRTENAHE